MELWTRVAFHHSVFGGSSNLTMNTMASSMPDSKTNALIAEILLEDFQVIRTAHLVLSGFSIAASLLVILSILNDARKAAKFEVALRPRYQASIDSVVIWFTNAFDVESFAASPKSTKLKCCLWHYQWRSLYSRLCSSRFKLRGWVAYSFLDA